MGGARRAPSPSAARHLPPRAGRAAAWIEPSSTRRALSIANPRELVRLATAEARPRTLRRPWYPWRMDPRDVEHFRALGFVVLRGAVPADALRQELVAVLARAAPPSQTAVARVQCVPMMTSRTPTSLALLDRLEHDAAALLGGTVLPVRAKGIRTSGATSWHVDSRAPVASVGFAAYLDPSTATAGALRVMPGTHLAAARLGERPEPLALATAPGDLIAFHEHLRHASDEGAERLQWRVDFVREPGNAAEDSAVRAYFAGIYAEGTDAGYDPDAHPTYDEAWLTSGRRCVDRLRALGALALAARHEDRMRARRAASAR